MISYRGECQMPYLGKSVAVPPFPFFVPFFPFFLLFYKFLFLIFFWLLLLFSLFSLLAGEGQNGID